MRSKRVRVTEVKERKGKGEGRWEDGRETWRRFMVRALGWFPKLAAHDAEAERSRRVALIFPPDISMPLILCENAAVGHTVSRNRSGHRHVDGFDQHVLRFS